MDIMPWLIFDVGKAKPGLIRDSMGVHSGHTRGQRPVTGTATATGGSDGQQAAVDRLQPGATVRSESGRSRRAQALRHEVGWSRRRVVARTSTNVSMACATLTPLTTPAWASRT